MLPYAAAPSLDAQFVFDDPDRSTVQPSVVADIGDNASGEGRNDQTIGLMFAFELIADANNRSFESNNHRAMRFVKSDP